MFNQRYKTFPAFVELMIQACSSYNTSLPGILPVQNRIRAGRHYARSGNCLAHVNIAILCPVIRLKNWALRAQLRKRRRVWHVDSIDTVRCTCGDEFGTTYNPERITLRLISHADGEQDDPYNFLRQARATRRQAIAPNALLWHGIGKLSPFVTSPWRLFPIVLPESSGVLVSQAIDEA